MNTNNSIENNIWKFLDKPIQAFVNYKACFEVGLCDLTGKCESWSIDLYKYLKKQNLKNENGEVYQYSIGYKPDMFSLGEWHRGDNHYFVIVSKENNCKEIPVAIICPTFSQFGNNATIKIAVEEIYNNSRKIYFTTTNRINLHYAIILDFKHASHFYGFKWNPYHWYQETENIFRIDNQSSNNNEEYDVQEWQKNQIENDN